MTASTKQIVEKAWSFAHVLREEGLSYLAYIEQITFLIFLKMAHEVAERSPDQKPLVPEGWGWDSLVERTGSDLIRHYDHVLDHLSHQPGMLGDIFRKPRPEIENPRTLRRLIVDLIGGENWSALDSDVKGDIYEGLLARTASESPRGAGQYFTPRALIDAIVDCMRPTASETVCDPAAGTGGFLLAAHRYAREGSGVRLTRQQRDRLRTSFVYGWELVPNTARLCAMNLYLHGIEADPSPIRAGVDALKMPAERKFDVVLTNPPFGTRGALTGDIEAGDEAQSQTRADFWTTTSNKQLNFIQHAFTLLRSGGRCAIVVPDNVLFEAGAGEVIRRNLLTTCNVHTLLRLPTGIFYAQGVKANVLFFDREPPDRRSGLWVYDLRTDKHFTLRQRQIQRSDFDEFVGYYRSGEAEKRRPSWREDRPDGRWRRYDTTELLRRDRANLDLLWLKEAGVKNRRSSLCPPDELATRIAEQLRAAVDQFESVSKRLGKP